MHISNQEVKLLSEAICSSEEELAALFAGGTGKEVLLVISSNLTARANMYTALAKRFTDKAAIGGYLYLVL